MGSLLDKTSWMKMFWNGVSQLTCSLFVLFFALKDYHNFSFLYIDGSHNKVLILKVNIQNGPSDDEEEKREEIVDDNTFTFHNRKEEEEDYKSFSKEEEDDNEEEEEEEKRTATRTQRRWRKKGVNGIHANQLSIENLCAP